MEKEREKEERMRERGMEKEREKEERMRERGMEKEKEKEERERKEKEERMGVGGNGERSRQTPRQTDRQRGPTPTHVNIIFAERPQKRGCLLGTRTGGGGGMGGGARE